MTPPAPSPTSISSPCWGLIPIPLPHQFQVQFPAFPCPCPQGVARGCCREGSRVAAGQGKAGPAVPFPFVPQFPWIQNKDGFLLQKEREQRVGSRRLRGAGEAFGADAQPGQGAEGMPLQPAHRRGHSGAEEALGVPRATAAEQLCLCRAGIPRGTPGAAARTWQGLHTHLPACGAGLGSGKGGHGTGHTALDLLPRPTSGPC